MAKAKQTTPEKSDLAKAVEAVEAKQAANKAASKKGAKKAAEKKPAKAETKKQPAKKSDKPKVTIGSVAIAALRKKADAGAALEAVKKQFPEAKTTIGCIYWYASQEGIRLQKEAKEKAA